MRLLLFISCLPVIGFSQVDSLRSLVPVLPPEKVLIESLISYEKGIEVADLELYKESKSYDWLDYLPSIGITYQDGGVRPLVNYSVSRLASRIKGNQRNRTRIKSIEMKNSVRLEKKVNRLKRLIRKYEIEKSVYLNYLEILETEILLYEFQEAKYKEALIKPSEFLKEKKRVQIAHLDSTKKLFQLNESYNLVLETAYY